MLASSRANIVLGHRTRCQHFRQARNVLAIWRGGLSQSRSVLRNYQVSRLFSQSGAVRKPHLPGLG